MISHKYKFISVHTNKCAASTMEFVLKPFCDVNVDKHANLRSQLNLADSNYFKFAYVRNPWDKMVSQYHFNAKDFFTDGIDFESYIHEFYSGKKVSNCNPLHYPWLLDNTGNINIDFIGKFHQLQKDFDEITNILGLPETKLPHKNSTSHKHYTEYYNDETKHMIAEIFAEDIKLFNLNFLNE